MPSVVMYLSSIVIEGKRGIIQLSGRRKFLSVGSGQWPVAMVPVLLRMEDRVHDANLLCFDCIRLLSALPTADQGTQYTDPPSCKT